MRCRSLPKSLLKRNQELRRKRGMKKQWVEWVEMTEVEVEAEEEWVEWVIQIF